MSGVLVVTVCPSNGEVIVGAAVCANAAAGAKNEASTTTRSAETKARERRLRRERS